MKIAPDKRSAILGQHPDKRNAILGQHPDRAQRNPGTASWARDTNA
jgi:hypothetical protein